MPREDFVKEYMVVRSVTFKSQTIRTAWRKSSCWPVDSTIFKDDDFAPSVSTSTTATHVPASFPILLHGEHRFYDEELDVDPIAVNNDIEEDEDNDSDSNPLDSDTLDPEPEDDHGPVDRRDCIPSVLTGPNHEPTQPVLSAGPSISQAIPPSSFYAQMPHYSRTRRRQGMGMKERLDQLEADNTSLHSRVATLEAHCAMAHSEIQDMKRRANARDSRSRKRAKLNVDARCLTSAEGLRLSREQATLKAAQEQKKHEAEEQRAAKQAERQWQRMDRDPNELFIGALTTKSKPDLQDVAQALGL